MSAGTTAVAARLRRIVWGTEGPRIRAPYRVLLPLLLLTIVLTQLAVLLAGAVVPLGTSGVVVVLVTGLFQASFVAVMLVIWARYVDHRPVRDYGRAASPDWVLDLGVAFGAVLIGHAIWYTVGAALGWTDVTLSLSTGEMPLVVGLLAIFVAMGVNQWVQETVFVAIPIRNAAEGLAAWGVTPRRAILAAWAVATLLFTLSHTNPNLSTWINHLVGLGVYALLYVHTGELAFPVGVHFGVNYSANALFVTGSGTGELALFEVTESLGGLVGGLSGGRLPQILLAYLLLLTWVHWRSGTVSIRTDIAEWTPRQPGESGDEDSLPAS